ncbi:hypothetical protein ACG33_12195 [Steroidobacter denitrificans]|uniref:Haloacid dehalogenase n=1 Tax=Steroidobacter denitrificans TaxID=465721 RepID=A0A127FDT4_STEDE|nr:GMP/IMP nucleotidase [Steroidobacter denitrificans]AMN47845.1 hypothetical protein ACG33_12195 [Steroidobacter denitrificans]
MASTSRHPVSGTIPKPGRPRWSEIDTVMLDMDGTLLDLHFDNYFWGQLLPRQYAARHALSLEAARAALQPLFQANEGTLAWYCTDFWSRELGFDVAALKRTVSDRVRFLPGAERFLRRLGELPLRKILVTNAHRDSLAIKAQRTGLLRYFDQAVSSHDLGQPKESAAFWPRLQAMLGFDPAGSLFVDDSLGVLRAAKRHGIGQVFAISRPDSSCEGRQVEEFAAVEAVERLLDSLPAATPDGGAFLG